jgi:hypothetical protein
MRPSICCPLPFGLLAGLALHALARRRVILGLCLGVVIRA